MNISNTFFVLALLAVGIVIFFLQFGRPTRNTELDSASPHPDSLREPGLHTDESSPDTFLVDDEIAEELQLPALLAPLEKIDTEGAIEDMRLAHSYLDDWGKTKNDDHVLGLAAKYIQSARAKDPNTTVQVKNSKGELVEYTQDQLAGQTLFCEAHLYSGWHGTYTNPEMLEKARDIFRKAISYQPSSILYRERLADVYLDLHDRGSALALAQEAVRLDPKNLDARKLLVRIEAAPVTSAPTFIDRNPELLVTLAGLMLFGGFVAFVAAIFGSRYGNLFIPLFIIGGALWFYGRSKENEQMLNKAIANEKRKNKG